VVVAVSGLALGATAQQAGTARVILARPPVEVIPRGQTTGRALATGARIAEGDRVRTGRGGVAEIELGDGSLVRLGELSDLEIDRLDVDAAGTPTTSRFGIAAGQARAWVARQVIAKVAAGTGRFTMQTPTAVAAVRQTDFAVTHEPDRGSRVFAFAGVVEVSGARPQVFVVLTRNRFTEVQLGADPTPPRVIPLREKRSLLKLLSFRAVSVPGPRDPDLGAVQQIRTKTSTEKLTGERATQPAAALPTPVPAPRQTPAVGTVDIVVTTD